MTRSPHTTFVATLALAILVTFVVGAVATPPDPFTQLLFTAAALPVVLLLSYLLAYRGGYDYVDGLLNGGRTD